ncbi:MAG: hypothetical protein KBD96_00700 [Brachymonas sp.]|jgi:hypothetical protein|nr:hypothetical protein [Brachymonas sp.]MBP6138904.1 hypothetical protein [Brachymonas sp.]MBP6966370.1 hypothetical protein [Brachymonas sp.]MBP7246597.1 hypothetical protein [Brachymonas sp.]MBP7740231.1 hypothetical protein [Brachymonas sp.]
MGGIVRHAHGQISRVIVAATSDVPDFACFFLALCIKRAIISDFAIGCVAGACMHLFCLQPVKALHQPFFKGAGYGRSAKQEIAFQARHASFT